MADQQEEFTWPMSTCTDSWTLHLHVVLLFLGGLKSRIYLNQLIIGLGLVFEVEQRRQLRKEVLSAIGP